MDKNLHLYVMYAADENYAPYLGVSLFSLFENNKSISEITVYAVLDGVSEENKNRLTQIFNEDIYDFLIDCILYWLKNYFATKNLAKKSVIDERFFA